MQRTTPSTATVLRRGVRARCPACGVGRLFLRVVESERVCAACGWRLERCAGHWVGGNEINLLATFTVGVAAFVACVLCAGLGPLAVWLPVAASGVFSIAFYRSSRGLFFAIDYLVDPDADSNRGVPPSGDGLEPRDPHDPRDDDPDRRAPRRPRSGIPASTAAFPPPPAVSCPPAVGGVR